MKNTLLSNVTALFLMFSAASIYAQEAPKNDAIANPTTQSNQAVAVNNQQGTGKLHVDVKEFKSEIELKPKVESTLKAGGLDWGVKDGQMVVTMVNKSFVNFDFPHFTRFGTNADVELPAGEYTITGIGLVASTAFSVEKILNKGAYLNFDVLKFKVEAGKTTTLTIQPQIKKNATFLLNFFLPYYYATVSTETGTTEEIALTEKLPTSVPWSTYDGPLKFKAK